MAAQLSGSSASTELLDALARYEEALNRRGVTIKLSESVKNILFDGFPLVAYFEAIVDVCKEVSQDTCRGLEILINSFLSQYADDLVFGFFKTVSRFFVVHPCFLTISVLSQYFEA